MNTLSEGSLIKFDAIRKTKQELESLAIVAKSAADTFSEAIKLAAKHANVDPAVLRAYIKAGISETPEKARSQAHQLSLLFEEE